VDDYLSEQEQWERFKAWIRQNGPWAVAGVLLAVAALSGWRWWQARAEQRLLGAAAAYQQLLAVFSRNDLAAAEQQTNEMVAKYAGTGYADQAELAAARLEIENDKAPAAAERLQRVMQHSKDPAVALLARLRLARVQIDLDQPDAALATLGAVQPGAYASRYAEARGDALLAKGDRAAALSAYQQARAARGAAGGDDLLDLKINDLTRS